MDWKRISVIVVIYVSCFIAIALLCYYTSNEGFGSINRIRKFIKRRRRRPMIYPSDLKVLNHNDQ